MLLNISFVQLAFNIIPFSKTKVDSSLFKQTLFMLVSLILLFKLIPTKHSFRYFDRRIINEEFVRLYEELAIKITGIFTKLLKLSLIPGFPNQIPHVQKRP